MTFHKIDMQAWERKKRYEHYAEAVPCTYSMTVALDVTKLLCGVREKGLPFFPVVLYGLAREVNRHAEFRMAQDEMGNVGYYSHCDPCYTVFHKETESFTEVWTAYDASPAVFLAGIGRIWRGTGMLRSFQSRPQAKTCSTCPAFPGRALQAST